MSDDVFTDMLEDDPDDDLTREEFEAAMQESPAPPTVEDKRCNCARPEVTAFNRRCRACNLMTTPPEPVMSTPWEERNAVSLEIARLKTPPAERPTPEVWNPLDHGIHGVPLMVPAHEYNRMKSDLERQLAEAQKQRDTLADALRRIKRGDDAPDIDAVGEWQIGLHCGVEDRDCRDRYEGAYYGHTVGVEKALEWAINEATAALATLERKEEGGRMKLTEEQRQKVNQFIAEKLGWRIKQNPEGKGVKWVGPNGEGIHGDGQYGWGYADQPNRRALPNYTRSLDACREVAMSLDRNSLAYSDYCSRLNAAVAIENSRSGTRPIQAIDATSEQRALALFQTLGGEL